MSTNCEEQRERIVSEIQRMALENGCMAPTAVQFARATGFKRVWWTGRLWARWSDALREAGLSPNLSNGQRFDDEFMLGKFADAARHFRRIPFGADIDLYRMQDPSCPVQGSFRSHFGGRKGLINRLRQWAAANPDRADIQDLIREYDKSRLVKPPDNCGSVYLLKWEDSFKIGRAKVLARRVRDIQNLLPASSFLVHAIQTEDPAGIEAYWHRRFAEKRVKGEWFNLTAEDVAAFKKHKRQ